MPYLAPIDEFTLTDEHLKLGKVSSCSECPVALMLAQGKQTPPYEQITVERMDIEYSQWDEALAELMHHSKVNTWPLFALIHFFDHPATQIVHINTTTGVHTIIFGPNHPLQPPYTVQEYENRFHLILPGFETDACDDYEFHSIFDHNEVLRELHIHSTPKEVPLNERTLD